jgi:streptogramin lyase
MTPLVRRVSLAIVAALTVTVVGVTSAQEQTAPTPQELKEAIDTIKDVYESYYKDAETDTKAKKALARKLFEGAPKRKTSVMRYASYEEARRLAASAGDAKTALDALTILSTQFKGTPASLADETLKVLGDTNFTPESVIGLLTLATEGANAALEREDYAGAVTLAKLLVTAAKKSEDPDQLADAKKLLHKVETLKTAVDTIKTKPGDPDANEALGQYWTFTRGRWELGLKYLAKGTNKELAEAAAKDVANPKTAKERTAVADAWYKLAKNAKGTEQRSMIDRAWHWYSAAIAVAAGDEDFKPSERIKEIEKKYPELFDQTLTGHTGAVANVAVSPDGKTLVSVGNDNTVRLWNVATGKLLKTLEGHTAWVGSVVITPDSNSVITAGGDNIIRVWDLKTQKEVKKLEGHTVAIRGLALTAGGKTLISGASDKTCRAWDLATGKEIKRYGDEKASVESVAVTPDGKYVLAGNDVGVITVFNAKTGAVLSKYDKHEGTMVYTITTSSDGKTAYSGARDKDIHVWDVATGKEIRRLKGHTEQVYQLTFSHDGKHLASAGYDKTVRVWDVATGQQLKKFEGHTDGVQGVCFTPDGRFLFSASWDKTIRKWRLPAFRASAKKVD